MSRQAEAAEIEQLVHGLLLPRATGRSAEVFVSDCMFVYAAVIHDGQVAYCRKEKLFLSSLDMHVAHVHMPFPLAHVAVAAFLRLKGVPVVLSPMGMLGEDYARSTWFRGRRTAFARIKPAAVAVLRAGWLCLAQRFVCLSSEEVRLARLPPSRSAALPWPVPLTALGQAGSRPRRTANPCSTNGPVAFIARFDVQRKGIDRLATWLLAYADSLPRPAAILFAPDSSNGLELLEEVVRRGLLEWDRTTSGSDLLHRLSECRAVMLLSRWEAQPRALREAAVIGLPTITTDTGNFADVSVVLGSGIAVDGDDPAAIQQAFDDVLCLPRTPERARSLFDPRNVGAFLFHLLKDVSNGIPWDHNDYYRDWTEACDPSVPPPPPAPTGW